MKSTLTFHGGAGSVTGANFLLDTGEGMLLIDCGAVAQEQVCDPVNLEAFPYDPARIDALIVTHAHQDHIGRIPRLVREGFRGTIHSTRATKDLSAVMLDDALSVMQEEVETHGCELLYERKDLEDALALWQGHEYHAPFTAGGVTVELLDAGHILGSALVKISRLRQGSGGQARSIVFTGDLGNVPEPLLQDTESPEGAQYIVMESVYGDRVHEGRDERRARLKEVVEETMGQKGTLLIPSFSLERTQVLLYELHRMIEKGELQPFRLYMDSPLAGRVTEVFRRYPALFNERARRHVEAGEDPFSFPGFSIVETTEQSRAIHRDGGPKVIIAGAGMSAGGRVRSHEKVYLEDKNSTLLFVGYQAAGTLGRRIQEGAKKVMIDREHVRIRAHIETLTGYSGHADREQLLDFVEAAGEGVERVFVAMGEPRSSLFFAQRAHEFLGVDAIVPKKGETFELEL